MLAASSLHKSLHSHNHIVTAQLLIWRTALSLVIVIDAASLITTCYHYVCTMFLCYTASLCGD
jgi:hypothetical protein